MSSPSFFLSFLDRGVKHARVPLINRSQQSFAPPPSFSLPRNNCLPETTMDLASIYFGFFLAVFVFTQAKVVQQTRTIWRHRRSLLNSYLLMIWVEAWVNFVFALITYLFLNGVIPGRLVSVLRKVLDSKGC